MDPKLVDLVAEGAQVDKHSLRAQYEDIFPRACAEKVLISKSKDPNKCAWKSVIDSINARASVARMHPTNELVSALVLWFSFGISSSGVEQGFSQAQWGFGNRRQGAHADTEEYVVRLILDLKNHDKSKTIEVARKIWMLVYGSCRASSTRITKGVGTRSNTDPHTKAVASGFACESESAFIRLRRKSISSNPSGAIDNHYEALMQQAESAKDDEIGWSAAHTKELDFQKKKLRIRQIQGVREGVLAADPELTRSMHEASAKQIKSQQAKRRKESRDDAVLAGLSGAELLQKIRNLGVHVTSGVPAAKRDALRLAFMKLHMYEAPMHAADVFVVTHLGHAGKSILAPTALRGSYHVTPDLLLSNGSDGLALKWHAIAQVSRVVFVSAACRARQAAGLQYVQTILDAIRPRKISLEDGDWNRLAELKRMHAGHPARVIALVTADDKACPATFVINV